MGYSPLWNGRRTAEFLAIMIAIVVLPSGCFVVPEITTQEVRITSGDLLRLEVKVEHGETVEGSWRAADIISGSYIRPDGTRLRWAQSSTRHDFVLDGVERPGEYIFEFYNSGEESAKLVFQYRTQQPNAAAPTSETSDRRN